MVFSSLAFLCVFLPVVFLLTVVVRNLRVQNVLLLLASLLFYAYGEPLYVFLTIGVSAFAWLAGVALGRFDQASRRKACVAVSVIVALGCLGVFKYATWVSTMASSAFGWSFALAGIELPVGISFFTFQAISYVIDVYRKDVKPQNNLLLVMLYISFFPQLIAGPIVRYHDIEQQMTNRKITWSGVNTGVKRFILGLAKKVLIADVLAVAADAIFGAELSDVTGPAALLAALAYAFQIYFDFSAYSDMAIGMAKAFGFSYKENFNYPYVSTTIKQFWRRWHISLSTWFLEYLYIPLGGNRKGRLRTVANKMIVFLLCGLWHGAAWTFVVWGLIHGFFQLLEEYLPIRNLPKPLGWIYCFAVVVLSFVLFRADNFDQGLYFIGQIFTGWGAMSNDAMVLLMAQLTPLFIFTFVIAVIGAFPWLPKVKGRLLLASESTQAFADLISSIACIGLLIVCILTLAGGAYSPFIYFRF